MFTITELAVDALESFLAADMGRRLGSSSAKLCELVPAIGRLALECIGKSNALYHNVEHTMLVTLAAHDILKGRAVFSAARPADYAHLIVASLLHDIGYVRGIIDGDNGERYVIDLSGRTVCLPPDASDAALTPYHVDRSKLFAIQRLSEVEELDAQRIARAIEFTRFPESLTGHAMASDEEGSLLRAADFIGQFGDPDYLRKANALYYEFEEVGLNKKFGYASPADLIDQYSDFYWNNVSRHIQTAIRYLDVTASGRWWIANLYSNIFRAQRYRDCSDRGTGRPEL